MAPVTADAPVAPAHGRRGGYRWYVLVLLTVAYAVHAIDRTVIGVLIEPIKHEFGLSDSALGFLTGFAYAAPFAAAGLPLGALVDRVRRQRMLAALLVIWSGMTAAGALCQSFVALLLSRAAVGAAESGSPPTALSLLSDYFPPRLRAFATSIFYVGAPVGSVMGVYFTATITAAHGWRAAMLAAGAPGVALALLILLTLREPARGALDPANARNAVPFLAVLRLIWRNPSLLLIVTALVLMSMAVIGSGAWLQAVMLRNYHLPMARVGVLSGLAGVLGAGGTFMGGVLGALVARGRTVRLLLICGISILAAAPFNLLVMLGAGQPLNLVVFFVAAALGPLYYGPGFGLALSLAPPAMRGRMMAITLVLANIVGTGAGPQIVGWLSDYLHARGDPLALPHAASSLTVVAVAGGLLFLAAMRVAPRGVTLPLDLAGSTPEETA